MKTVITVHFVLTYPLYFCVYAKIYAKCIHANKYTALHLISEVRSQFEPYSNTVKYVSGKMCSKAYEILV